MAISLDYAKIENSCSSLTNLASNMQELIDVLDPKKSALADSWEGEAANTYITDLEALISSLTESKKTLALSILYLASVSEGYQSIDQHTIKTLMGLIGGAEFANDPDSGNYPSSEEILTLMGHTAVIPQELSNINIDLDYKNPGGLSGYRLDFINEIKQGAIDTYNEYGILPSLTLAQAILETGWGQSRIGNNIFGIKGSWNGKSQTVSTQEYENGRYVTKNATFRDYDTVSQSIIDHAQLLNNDRYQEVPKAKNYVEASRAVHRAGYATDPSYSDKLIDIIESFGLDQWDNINTSATSTVVTAIAATSSIPTGLTKSNQGIVLNTNLSGIASEIGSQLDNNGYAAYGGGNYTGKECDNFARGYALYAQTGEYAPYGNISEGGNGLEKMTYYAQDRRDQARFAYERLLSGKPAVLHINSGYDGGGTALGHWVTAVGFKEGTTIDNVKVDDLIVIDPADAQIKPLSDNPYYCREGLEDCNYPGERDFNIIYYE